MFLSCLFPLPHSGTRSDHPNTSNEQKLTTAWFETKLLFVTFLFFILFYFILFYFILFYFILFYFILFYFIYLLFCNCCVKKWRIKDSSVTEDLLLDYGIIKDTIPAPEFIPLNAELNPICHLVALLGVHHFLHVSRIRVK